MGDKAESSSSLARKIPILSSVTEYATWRPLMEQYLIYLGLQDVLTMKFESWKALVKIADQMEEKRTNPLYSRLGISFTESAQPASIKAEGEAKNLENPIVAAAELKEVKLLVKQV